MGLFHSSDLVSVRRLQNSLRMRWCAALLMVFVLALTGCNTPSVPIPPPSPELMSFEVDTDGGVAQFEYDANASYGGAIVYVFNRDVGTGVITTARNDGSVGPTEPFPALEGDEVVVSFELDTQFSSTCVKIAAGRSSVANECSP